MFCSAALPCLSLPTSASPPPPLSSLTAQQAASKAWAAPPTHREDPGGLPERFISTPSGSVPRCQAAAPQRRQDEKQALESEPGRRGFIGAVWKRRGRRASRVDAAACQAPGALVGAIRKPTQQQCSLACQRAATRPTPAQDGCARHTVADLRHLK